jgi:hypothetical protein
LNDSFEVTMSPTGSMRIERDWSGAEGRGARHRHGLVAWVDEMTGDEGMLWRACHSTHAARDRYAPAR